MCWETILPGEGLFSAGQTGRGSPFPRKGILTLLCWPPAHCLLLRNRHHLTLGSQQKPLPQPLTPHLPAHRLALAPPHLSPALSWNLKHSISALYPHVFHLPLIPGSLQPLFQHAQIFPSGIVNLGSPGAQMVRICLQCRRPAFKPWVGKILWRREWLPTPVFLLGKCHGQRSLAGYSPWGYKELDTTERLTFTQS